MFLSMIKNYFKTAWRNLLRNKMSAVINVGGLAVGMVVAVLIGLWIYDELSFSKTFKNYDRIAQVMQRQVFDGITETQQSVPFPLGKELRSRYGSDFKHVIMASWQGDHILTSGEKHLSQPGIYMDKGADEMLSLKMLKGGYGGLNSPNAILLSSSVAKAFFGNEDPVGRMMKIDSKLDVSVAGVYEDLPRNAAFSDARFIAPWDLYITSETWIKTRENEWGDNSFQTFVQLADKTDLQTVNKKINRAKYNNGGDRLKKFNPEIFLLPMCDWHLKNNFDNNGKQSGGPIEYVWMFGIIGVFVLMLACINFMNLSTARSEKRAKEVGIRKTVGSLRRQLVAQFYVESLLVVCFAFGLALLIVAASIPGFNKLAGKGIVVPWQNGGFWLAGVVFVFITAFVAGSYPALYLSGFKPVKVLKGTFRMGRFAALPRKTMVVVQFTISIALIIGTIIVYEQIQYNKNRPVGYDRKGIVMIQMKSPEFYGKLDLLKETLEGNGAIAAIAESSSPITGIWSSGNDYRWDGKDPALSQDFIQVRVTHDYGQTMSWKIKEGRDFSRAFSTDSTGLIVNEAAVKYMGIKNPVGTVVRQGNDSSARKYTIIGVTKDIIMGSPYEPVRQTFYFLDYERVNWINLKLNPDKSAAESLAKIEAAFKKFVPSAPFDYKFADAEFSMKFATEERVGELAAFFSVLAIFISCLGLFGLASFMAEQRTKEVGVRKVLGATIFGLWKLLSKDFVYLVVTSCVIAIPVAGYFMNKWLSKYQYRISISYWIFVDAVLLALLVTLLTVSWQAVKAALANPVKSLRTE